jgi:hypothetical protein
MLDVTNEEFLMAIMGEDWDTTHVTDFIYDPGAIPNNKHLISWKGDYFRNYTFEKQSNQYFTISHFDADEQGIARRRKALFKHTRVIVLDDVKEKLSMREVKKLPEPSWVLETSKGSEQWGYILDKPCTDRARVENLLDGLVANGLAPEGRDPGMKGVTRYVRLPEGYNNKASKLIENQPFKCQLKVWQPFNTTTLEKLAQPFNVDLNAMRRDDRADGAADVPNHPVLNVPGVITVKQVRSAGRFDITCPWVNEHTGGDDSGAAIFTNDDGSIGFKCHHGACQDKTGNDLMRFIESREPGFAMEYGRFKKVRTFADVSDVSFMEPVEPVEPATETSKNLLDELRTMPKNDPKARQLASEILESADGLKHIDRMVYHDEICHIMRWSKKDFKMIIEDLRKEWYQKKNDDPDFCTNIFFIKEQNQFYDYESRMFFTPEAFQNSFVHKDSEARRNALQQAHKKVDKLDYAPNKPRIFTEKNTMYGNTWYKGDEMEGAPGDISVWFEHFDTLGWTNYRDHIIKFMAYTLQKPEKKINHALVLGGREGIGKDFLLYPLMKAMANNSKIINGEELLSEFHDFLLSTKHLHINEVEHGDHRDSQRVSGKLKAILTAPPDTIRVNQKNIKPIQVRNIVNVTMTTNSPHPIKMQDGLSRRYYALWSDLRVRDGNSFEMYPEWRDYWEKAWTWMDKQENLSACIYYLRKVVDVSGFNAAEAPPMTDYLRDIQEISKSPAEATIEAFIRRKRVLFECDILTAEDMYTSLLVGSCEYPEDMQAEIKWFTTTRISRVVSSMDMVIKKRVRTQFGNTVLFIVRNHNDYIKMSPAKLHQFYSQHMKTVRKNVKIPKSNKILRLVK